MKNLIVFDKDLVIVELINVSTAKLENNRYNDKYYFINNQDSLFFKLTELIQNYEFKFKTNPIKIDGEITLNQLESTKRDIKHHYTKEDVLAKGIMEATLKEAALSKQTKGLALGVMENDLTNEQLKNQVKVLSKAILELSLK